MRIEVPRYGSNVTGLPDRAVVITNSERRLAACPLRWLFKYSDGLEPVTRARPLRMGSAVHAWFEDVQRWWQMHDTSYPGAPTGNPATEPLCVWCGGISWTESQDDCAHCGSTGHGPVQRSLKEWLQYAGTGLDSEFTAEQAEAEAQILSDVVYGWAMRYGLEPPVDYIVRGVELRLAVPIRGPTGSLYAPRTWIVPDGGGWRLARTGEAGHLGAKLVRWPWYQALTLDALWQHRTSGGLYVYESKTARAPASRIAQVSVDPQVAGYVWALSEASELGLLPTPQGARAEGYTFDVSTNQKMSRAKALKPAKVHRRRVDGALLYQQAKANGGGVDTTETSRKAWELDADGDPVLRSPGLSMRSNSGVPSWLFRQAIEDNGFDAADYQDHLLDLMASVDVRLYQRISGTCGPEVQQRYGRELYSVARQLAGWRRKGAELTSQAERELGFPRQPVCMVGQSCPYRGPCLQDGDLVRADYNLAATTRWLPDTDTDEADEAREKLGW